MRQAMMLAIGLALAAWAVGCASDDGHNGSTDGDLGEMETSEEEEADGTADGDSPDQAIDYDRDDIVIETEPDSADRPSENDGLTENEESEGTESETETVECPPTLPCEEGCEGEHTALVCRTRTDEEGCVIVTSYAVDCGSALCVRDETLSESWQVYCDAPPPLSGAAMVYSDYYSRTAVGLIDRETWTRAPSLLLDNQGEAVLSNDVVLANVPSRPNTLLVVDRGNSRLHLFDTSARAVSQTVEFDQGFVQNWQDALFVPGGRLYVTRYETNPAPEPEGPFAQGDDLIVIDAGLSQILSSLSFASLVPEGYQARPQRMVYDRGLVYVILGMINGDFSLGTDGFLVAVDPVTDSIVASGAIPRHNCTDLVPGRNHEIFVVCGGMYGETPLSSGLMGVVRDGESLLLGDVSTETFGLGLSNYIAASGSRVFYVRTGDFGASTPDELWRFDPSADPANLLVAQGSAPYTLGEMFVDAEKGRLVLPDADAASPRIRLFDLSGESVNELTGSAIPVPAGELPPPRNGGGF